MSLALTVIEAMCIGDFEEQYKLLSHRFNYEAVFRTTLSLEWSVNKIEEKYIYQIGLNIFLYFNCTQNFYENSQTFKCRHSKSSFFCMVKTLFTKFCARKSVKNQTENHILSVNHEEKL